MCSLGFVADAPRVQEEGLFQRTPPGPKGSLACAKRKAPVAYFLSMPIVSQITIASDIDGECKEG